MYKIKKIMIVGGGTSGWMTAAALAKFLIPHGIDIELIESSAISSVGVGEATIPHIRVFNDMLGIDENEFIRETGATYKLAIRFDGWGEKNSSYFHPFGVSGFPINGIDFHHYWLRLKQEAEVSEYGAYSFAAVAANLKRFGYPASNPNSPAHDFSYAFHIDASKYASFLKSRALAAGVTYIDGKVTEVTRDKEGAINAVQLDSGEFFVADFFIDCSGFRSLLLGESLGVEFESWAKWLPCDSAYAVPSEALSSPPSYTLSSAQLSGWQWRIPLQHRTGNGLVFSSSHQTNESALSTLLGNVSEPITADPKLLRFEAGKRKQSWEKNCVAIGLSAGFLEPLESTSLYLVQVAVQKFLELFSCEAAIGTTEMNAFNYLINIEYERIRDFLVLHYYANNRKDSDFWADCREVAIPSSLEEKLEIFRCGAGVVEYRHGLFMPASWLAVYLGQGVVPVTYDPRLKKMPLGKMKAFLAQVEWDVQRAVERYESHSLFVLRANSKASGAYPPASMSLYGAPR
ncbi:tryptophan halogenase family protein [Saccharophagus degradans]|uniref:Tryptophan halogenase n=1 Tax=Saccharophagus degradans (strain 2-40 / ATCC 43961 / DSM 17024) TaxID=203122 RepID=Q21LS3_SACD2|nr:tryptophan halogenase family protein [Saccharophagus degradans]ABD80356.1 tryptophan halogenase [Saccharophagus degradans 2-40]